MKIAFYRGTHKGWPGVFNRLVRWWTRGPYSHCEAVFTQTDPQGATLCASASKMDGGVRFKRIDLTSSNWDIFEFAADEAQCKEWFTKHIGLKYDVRGILGFVLRSGQDRNKYFCSEAVATSIGIDEAWRFDPNTFAAAIRRVAINGGNE
jgi:hypothetical protein